LAIKNRFIFVGFLRCYYLFDCASECKHLLIEIIWLWKLYWIFWEMSIKKIRLVT